MPSVGDHVVTLDKPLSLGCQQDVLKFLFSRLGMFLDNHDLLEMLLTMMPARSTGVSLIVVPHCGRKFWYQDLCLLVGICCAFSSQWILSICMELNGWQC